MNDLYLIMMAPYMEFGGTAVMVSRIYTYVL